MTAIQTSTTGMRCRCGAAPYRIELTPTDQLCPECFRDEVSDLAECDPAAADRYINTEDPHHERIGDDLLARLNEVTA